MPGTGVYVLRRLLKTIQLPPTAVAELDLKIGMYSSSPLMPQKYAHFIKKQDLFYILITISQLVIKCKVFYLIGSFFALNIFDLKACVD